MTGIVEIGKISARGQVAIPSDIRTQLNLKEGTKVLFFAENDTLLVKKITPQTFKEITKPFKAAARKAGFKESDVAEILHKVRKR